MHITIPAVVLAFVAAAVATPAVDLRGLTANAALNSLIEDSFSSAFPGIVLAAGCKNQKDCPKCKACTYCDDWTPGCCKRITPFCHAKADTVNTVGDLSDALCTFCSTKACFQISCPTKIHPDEIIHDASQIPIGDDKDAETVYDLDLVLDEPVNTADICLKQRLCCSGGQCSLCWRKIC